MIEPQNVAALISVGFVVVVGGGGGGVVVVVIVVVVVVVVLVVVVVVVVFALEYRCCFGKRNSVLLSISLCN